MSFNREQYLNEAVHAWRKIFRSHKIKVPQVWIGVGLLGRSNRTVGICHGTSASSDRKNHIWVSPTVNKTKDVLAITAHEMIHASLDCDGGHGAEFQKVARLVGLTSPWTQSKVGPRMEEYISDITKEIGQYKGPKFYTSNVQPTTTGSRMLKVLCPDCGYTLRTTKKWLDEYGAPICPCNKKTMDHDEY